MKKSNQPRHVVRKKTNARVSSERKQRESVKMHKERETNKIHHDDIDNIENECRGLLSTSRSIAELLRNKELIRRVTNLNHLVQLASVFQKDVVTFHERLNEISKHKPSRDTDLGDDGELINLYTLGQAYQEWLSTYQNVVLPNQLQISFILEEASKRQAPTSTNEVAQ